MKKIDLALPIILGLIAVALSACQSTATDIQRQDAANALACVREARELVAVNSPINDEFRALLLDGVPDTSPVLPREVSDASAALKLLTLAETSLYSVSEEFNVRPLQMERATRLVKARDYGELSRIASLAKVQAGRNPLDKIALALWGVSAVSLLAGLVVSGILVYLKMKNPAAEIMFRKFIGAFQITRTETPLEIAKEITQRYEGINLDDVKSIIKNSLDNSMRAKIPADVQNRIAEIKNKIGLGTGK